MSAVQHSGLFFIATPRAVCTGHPAAVPIGHVKHAGASRHPFSQQQRAHH